MIWNVAWTPTPEVAGWVVFIATKQNMAVGEALLAMGATGQCPVCRHFILPLGLGASRPLEVLSSCGTGQSGATPDSPVPL